MPQEVFPVLRQAIQSQYDREVRKNALSSIALISSRESAAGRPVSDAALVKDLVEISTDNDRLIRQTATYTLALVPTPIALDRLSTLLDDLDRNTQANAAVGLARNNDLRGLKVLKQILAQSNSEPPKPITPPLKEHQQSDNFENFVAVKNAITAIQNLAPKLTADQRAEFRDLLLKISEAHREPKIATEAQSAALRMAELNSKQP